MFCPLLSVRLCVAGSRSGSPGRVLTSTALSTMSTGAHRVLAGSSGDKNRRSRIPRSQGCSRDSSPTRLSVGKSCISFITTTQMLYDGLVLKTSLLTIVHVPLSLNFLPLLLPFLFSSCPWCFCPLAPSSISSIYNGASRGGKAPTSTRPSCYPSLHLNLSSSSKNHPSFSISIHHHKSHDLSPPSQSPPSSLIVPTSLTCL